MRLIIFVFGSVFGPNKFATEGVDERVAVSDMRREGRNKFPALFALSSVT